MSRVVWECLSQSSVNTLNGVKGSEISDDVIICDLTQADSDGMAEITEGSPRAASFTARYAGLLSRCHGAVQRSSTLICVLEQDH